MKLVGFQIDWSQKGGSDYGSIYIYCVCGHGEVIGLQPDSDYWFNVEVFNTAGTGSPSEKYLMNTWEWRKFLVATGSQCTCNIPETNRQPMQMACECSRYFSNIQKNACCNACIFYMNL